MNARGIFIGAAAIVGVAAILYSRRATAAFPLVENLNMDEPRGIRNNNPGNLIDNNIPWRGVVGTDGRYLVFDSAVNGIRAAAYNIQTAIVRRGNNTIRKLVNVWAPPTENLTGAYALDVSQRTGIGLDEPLDYTRDVFGLLVAIITHENGVQPYSDALIYQAIGAVPA